jgi:hypothetical protein
MKKILPLAFVALCAVQPSSVRAQTQAPPAIDHQAVACVAADKFPRLEARFTPAENVAAARVLFQGQTADWYSVAMKPDAAVYAGILPKPKKELKSFRYYIEITDKALATSRTAEFTAAVVDSAAACKGKLTAGAVSSASVLLQGPAGAAALPGGFASTGVVAGSAAGSGAATGAAGASSGSSAAGAGAAAGAGGGIGTTALVLGGVAVAGGAVAVGVSKSGESDDGGDDSPSSNISLSIAFLPLPGIDVSVCGPGLTTFNGQGVNFPSPSGSFNETWSPSTPNVMRVTGTGSPTSLQANISCTNGARSGTITASGSGYTMSGTFEFGPSRGQVSVTRTNF